MQERARQEIVDASVALDALAPTKEAENPPNVFAYLERDTSTETVREVGEVPKLDVDREAFELARGAREGTADARTAAAGRALLVCSPGGHLAQMLSLEPAWRELETTWVTLPAADVEYLLAGQDVVLGRGPTNRSLKNLVRNVGIAWRTVRDCRPDVILSTGAALAVPFFLVGRLHGCRCVYVESFTRVEGLSFSGRLVYPLANTFFVQWPSLAEGFRKAVYVGSVI